MRAVYLHGFGLVSSLGANLSEALKSLAAGGKEPQRLNLPGGTDWPCYSIEHSEKDWVRRAKQLIYNAVVEAGLKPEHAQDRNVPLFIASSSLDIGAIESGSSHLSDGFGFAQDVAEWLNWSSEVYLFSSACTSSLQAMLAASSLIGSGNVEEVVVLGIELSNRFSISGFASMQLLSSGKPKPLGAERDGIALGEAVAVMHLSCQPARWRMCGGSNIVDGRDPTGAVPETVARICEQALAVSGLTPSDIGLIKLQAAGSPANDAKELAGMAKVFEVMPPLVSLKSSIGHTLGASGVAEIALLTACLENGVWPQTNYVYDVELGYELSSIKPVAPRYILADILGFGGGHVAVILEDANVQRGINNNGMYP